ncbi:MAG: phosphoribosyltransferase [Planctomyces sp.]|nr:phosphoribosyltransferase [Planctomyces sp.]
MGCEGCDDRRDALNRVAPKLRLGDKVETMTRATGIRAVVDWLHDRKGRQKPRRSERAAPAGPRFVRTDELALDTLALIPRLPPDITRVVGVARSGLIPASILAAHLHLPLATLDQQTGAIVDCGHGWRLRGAERRSGRTLIVDDTVHSGAGLANVRKITEPLGDRLFAAVYVRPQASPKPDVWSVDLIGPHYLEWNLFSSPVTPHCAFDFDGILCHDVPPDHDDDGGLYLDTIVNTPPLYLPRRTPVHIVTARLEKYRQHTLDWCAKWGVPVASLTMGTWATAQERWATPDVVPAFKAAAFDRLAREGAIFGGPPTFVESCPDQARRIAELSGRWTLCPETAELHRPNT